jgi:hypothetical protein
MEAALRLGLDFWPARVVLGLTAPCGKGDSRKTLTLTRGAFTYLLRACFVVFLFIIMNIR